MARILSLIVFGAAFGRFVEAAFALLLPVLFTKVAQLELEPEPPPTFSVVFTFLLLEVEVVDEELPPSSLRILFGGMML